MDGTEEDRRRRARNSVLTLLLTGCFDTRFYHSLTEEGRWRRDRNIPRFALPNPYWAPWEHVYRSEDDGSLITVTGFDYNAFQFMLGIFTPYFEKYTPWSENGEFRARNCHEKRGRKRIINAAACLGLVLAWFRFRGGEYTLQGWFGFTGGHANIWLRFGRRMLLKALLNVPEALVRFPDDYQIKVYQEAIAMRHRSLTDVYCTMDGLKLRFQQGHGLTEQSMFYNGWLHGHFVTNLFVFGADGKIINAVINVPGSVHDSTLAVWGGTYRKLKSVYQRTGGICCVDSAFASQRVDYLLRSAQDNSSARDVRERARMDEATSLRQAAEWGMRAIQGSMPRLKDALKYENNGERRRILKLVPLLYNLRLARVGLNQIANVYVKNWSKDSQYLIK